MCTSFRSLFVHAISLMRSFFFWGKGALLRMNSISAGSFLHSMHKVMMIYCMKWKKTSKSALILHRPAPNKYLESRKRSASLEWPPKNFFPWKIRISMLLSQSHSIKAIPALHFHVLVIWILFHNDLLSQNKPISAQNSKKHLCFFLSSHRII